MPIVMGAPVGLATGADADDVAGADALVDAATGALAEAAAVEDPPPDEDVAAGVDFFDELQPATTSAVTAKAATDALESGRDRRDACNRLCETIESLHERWVSVRARFLTWP
ncbi:MAG TPA: hypothetical protein VGD55_14955 [Acidothermaceae bacterium]